MPSKYGFIGHRGAFPVSKLMNGMLLAAMILNKINLPLIISLSKGTKLHCKRFLTAIAEDQQKMVEGIRDARLGGVCISSTINFWPEQK